MNKLFLSSFLFFCCNLLFAQDAIIQGKVLAYGNGEPLGNIVIKLKNSKRVMVTDPSGAFSFRLSGLDTMEIDNMNYQRLRISVSSSTQVPLIIRLIPLEKMMDEVVVNTGYQSVPKERATGSFVAINKDLFNQQSGTTVLDRLENISNGLYVDRKTNGSSKIVIRGLSTIQGPRAPLIVLDDFPFEGDLQNIKPEDVESISILKDAAAASIWGTRAGNGVIVITTKKGKYNQPIRVELSSNVLITAAPDLSTQQTIRPADFVSVEQFLYAKGFYNSQLNSTPWLAVSPIVELLRQRDKGIITPAQADAAINILASHDLKDDFNKYVYQRGINFQQAITVKGGTKNMNWNLSGGWDKNSGVLDNQYNRINLRSSQSFRLTDQLELTTGIDYTQSTTQSGRLGFGQLRPFNGLLPAYTSLADANGNAVPVMYQYRKTYTDTVGGGVLPDWNWYPLTDYANTRSTGKLQAMMANTGLSYKMSKTFSLNLKYQYGRQQNTDAVLYSPDSYFARNFVNSYTVINRANGKLTYNVPQGGILDQGNGTLETQNVRGMLNYSKSSAKNDITAIAGAEYRQVKNNYSSYRVYGYDPDLLTYGTVDYKTAFPNLLTRSSSQIPANMSVSQTLNQYISFFANGAYTFKKKYTVSASARRDASNLFGVSANNRWSPLWSTGASWDIGKEIFFRVPVCNSLKLRVSYGMSGNADPSKSAVTTLLVTGNSAYTQTQEARITQFKNAELGWEKVKMLNLGIDFGLWNNRLRGTVEYYYKKGLDLFGTQPIDYTGLAFDRVTKNVAAISGHGWDISLNSQNIKGVFSWNTMLNLNFNKDRVVKNYLVNQQGSNYTLGGAISAVEGHPVFALYDYKWAGLDPATGDPMGVYQGASSKNYTAITGSGTLIADMQYIGPSLPTAVISLGNTFIWKNFSFNVNITGKFGAWFQRSSVNYGNLFNNRDGHTDYSLRWQQPGDELHTTIPSMIYPFNLRRDNFYTYSSVLATRGDFIRLQYITLAYDLKRKQGNKSPFESMQFYMNANNLGLLWRANQFNIDPEYSNTIPPSMNLAIGVRAAF